MAFFIIVTARLAQGPCLLFQPRFVWILILAWSALAATPAQAKDHIIERSWLEDPTRALQWPEVQQHSTHLFQGTLTKGFGESAIWLRLRIDPGAKTTSLHERLILRIRPVYLDDIQIYDPLSTDGLIGVTGDIHHPRLEEFRGLDFLVPFAKGTQPRYIWLRLVSTSTRQIDVQALTINDLNIRAHAQSLVFSAYVGLVAILAIWAMVHWFFSKEAVIGAFAIMQTGALFFALSSLGHLRAFWPQDWPAWILHEATTFFALTAVTAAEWFHVKLISDFDPPRWIRRLHTGLIGLLPLKLLLVKIGMTTVALRLNMTEVLIAPAIFTVSVLVASTRKGELKHGQRLPRGLMVSFYTLLLIMLMGAALPALGITQSSEVGLYIVQLHGLVTALLLLLILQYRAKLINKQQHETGLALERSLLQTQQERMVREEQEKLLAMLAHELKTPLATMHMRLDSTSAGSKEIKQAIRDMTNVIDRCQQTLQLSDRQLIPHIELLDMSSLIANAVASCQQPERVHMDLPERMWVQTDSQLCFIVLNNLIENACKYAVSESMISLRLTSGHLDSKDDVVKLEISNKPGQAGWPDADKIFNKYYRSPHARRQAGTGLGLFLVKNLAEAIQGRVEYAPTEKCIRFVLYLPRATQANRMETFGRAAQDFL